MFWVGGGRQQPNNPTHGRCAWEVRLGQGNGGCIYLGRDHQAGRDSRAKALRQDQLDLFREE